MKKILAYIVLGFAAALVIYTFVVLWKEIGIFMLALIIAIPFILAFVWAINELDS